MDVRLTRVQTAPENLDALVDAFTGSAVPRLREIPGYAGHSLAVNRESGDSQAATFWDSRSALEAGEEAATGIRDSTVGSASGTVVSIDRLELAMREMFTAPGLPACLRVIRGGVDPSRVDELVGLLRDDSLAIVRAQKGVRALTLGVDRTTGRFTITSVWDSPEDREASTTAITPMRERVMGTLGVADLEISEYEVAAVEFVGVGAARS